MSGPYFRPLIQSGQARPYGAVSLQDGPLWFERIECLQRDTPPKFLPVQDIPADIREKLISPQTPLCGLDLQAPKIMGILNTTPDSFSDGGQNYKFQDAITQAKMMIAEGADILDIGGESTRPGADIIPSDIETSRTTPVITTLRETGITLPISIDTRKADVARSAIANGANMLNDVTALSYDPDSLHLAARHRVPVVLMHAAGDPKTMQDSPEYSDVLLDVYDYLVARIKVCIAAEIPRRNIIIDPGIGFGKTLTHNLALLRGISLFHTLGCPILLGASRKSLIGTLGHAPNPADRLPGSLAIALYALNQGVQMLRVHDIAETKQAIRLWAALNI
ncbi:MAG: dihydropteroate synthase [Paracoccaceae bacterium]